MRRDLPELDALFQQAPRLNGPLSIVVKAVPPVRTVETRTRRSPQDVAPEALDAVLRPTRAKAVVAASVYLGVVYGTRVPVDLLQQPLQLLPVPLVEVSAVDLRNIGARIVLVVLEDDRRVLRLRALKKASSNISVVQTVMPRSAALALMNWIQYCPHWGGVDVSLSMQYRTWP